MTDENVLRSWGGQLSCSRFDAESGAFFTIALHSLRRGPAAGGTRAMHYSSPGAAVVDATRLASAMTYKMAIAGLPMGGGKSVIALPVPRHKVTSTQWQHILEVHAQNLRTLSGNYWTGPDVGTTSPDMDVLHAESGYAFGRTEKAGGPGSSAPETAHGVHVAIHASIREAGIGGLQGLRVLVQGLGAVGYDVAARVAAEGAQVIATDVDDARCKRARTAFGAKIIGVDEVLRTPSEVFVPCATGGLIDEAVARFLPTRVIAGAANNLLINASAADELASRGVVLAPDFVANGGGAIHLVGREVLGWSEDEVSAQVELIGTTLEQVFDRARADGVGTQRAAEALAHERIDN